MNFPCLKEAYVSLWDYNFSEFTHPRSAPRCTGYSLGSSPKTCFISYLFLVLDSEECLLYLFPRLFHGVSKDYLIHELGVSMSQVPPEGTKSDPDKRQTDHNCQTTSGSKIVFINTPEEVNIEAKENRHQ